MKTLSDGNKKMHDRYMLLTSGLYMIGYGRNRKTVYFEIAVLSNFE